MVARSGQWIRNVFAMRVQSAVVLLAVAIAAVSARPEESKRAEVVAAKEDKQEPAGKSKRGLFDLGLGHDFHDFGGHYDHGHISHVTITKEVKVPVPYSVEHVKHVPVPVHVKVPYDVPRPVHVPHPVPYPVEKVVHFPVEKPVAVPVHVPVKVPVIEKYPVYVPEKHVVHVDRPYPVVHKEVVKEPYPVLIHEKHHHDYGHYDHGHLLHGFH
ncbi:uncharacterized protein LOC106647469 [Copidosoma floridanum]|uniref:uncharacterized protein LOC106647469 n=1 Tax=Copidosoma floridanum TaxID=29053 RepID=UPI0006C9404F|nr:uncharacterized protein LOC106647469 [Copidosoma floridanum]